MATLLPMHKTSISKLNQSLSNCFWLSSCYALGRERTRKTKETAQCTLKHHFFTVEEWQSGIICYNFKTKGGAGWGGNPLQNKDDPILLPSPLWKHNCTTQGCPKHTNIKTGKRGLRVCNAETEKLGNILQDKLKKREEMHHSSEATETPVQTSNTR